MQLLRVIRISLLVGCFYSVGLSAQEEAIATAKTLPCPTTLCATVETAAIVDGNPVRRVYIQSGTNQLGFVLTDNLRLATTEDGKVQLVQNEMKYFLSIRVLTESQMAGVSRTETYRSLIDESYPGADFTSETTVTVSGREGIAYDLRWRSGGRTDRFVRVAYVSGNWGILELSLVADLAATNEGILNLSGLMQQLRSNQNGKLVMAPVKPLSFN